VNAITLRLFEFSHPCSRASFHRLSNLCRGDLQIKERDDLSEFALGILHQIFVAQHEKAGIALPGDKPCHHVLSPRPVRAYGCFPHQEPIYKRTHRQIIIDFPNLSEEVILRNYNVPWVANDVDHAWKCRIEAPMTLDNARPGSPVKIPSWGGWWKRHQAVNI